MSNHEETLSGRDFNRLSAFICQEAGIRLGPEKKTMLEARLKRRLRSLNLESYSRYCEYLFTPAGRREEMVPFIDVVTTNKTDFFREPGHFTFLAGQALPEMAARAEGRPLLVWSAGCSSGEEPYTLAMVLSEYAETHPGFRFRILATDISTQVLEKAQLGIYTDGEGGAGAAGAAQKISDAEPGARIGPGAGRAGAAAAGGIPAAELHGRRLRAGRARRTRSSAGTSSSISIAPRRKRFCASSRGSWCRRDICSSGIRRRCTTCIFL